MNLFKVKFSQLKTEFVGQTVKDLDLLYLEMEAEKFWIFTLLSMVAVGTIGLVLNVNIVMMIALIAIAFAIPRTLILLLRKRRMAKFNEQLVEGVDLIANSLRIGFNLHQSMKMVANEMPPPISQEFNLVLRENRLGIPLHKALEKLNQRLKSEDLNVVVTAVNIAQTVGGDLSEIFSRITQTIRARNMSHRRMVSLTTQGKLQGLILSILPFVIFIILYVWDKTYLSPLFTTKEGWTILTMVVALEATGIFFIMRIVNLDL
jgi:tight adherence protein B